MSGLTVRSEEVSLSGRVSRGPVMPLQESFLVPRLLSGGNTCVHDAWFTVDPVCPDMVTWQRRYPGRKLR